VYGNGAVVPIVAVALLAAGGSSMAAAQSQLRDRRLGERYQMVVDAYRSGQTEKAVNDALQLEPAALQAVDRIATRALKANLTDSTLDAAFFRAAAMLHTDAAYYCWRHARDKDAQLQLERARRMTDASASLKGASPSFRSDWYVASVLMISTVVDSEAALGYFADAIKALPDDARLLTTAGWFAERLSIMAAPPGSTPRGAQAQHVKYQQTAKRFLASALEVEPDAVEAALRMARITILAGNDRDAREWLLPLLARSDIEPDFAYVGRLLLGGVFEREHKADEAQRLYREAIALDDVAQSARVALSQLLYASGDAAAAADVIDPLIKRRASRDYNDPWSEYMLGYVPMGYALLDDLRKEVQQ
jgi:hypothetical protein